MENHFLNFTVKNFKGFKELKLENLGLFNFIVGDNNVGKTSLLEALLFDEDKKRFLGRLNNLIIGQRKLNVSGLRIEYLINRNLKTPFENGENLTFEANFVEGKKINIWVEKINNNLFLCEKEIDTKQAENIVDNSYYGQNNLPYIPINKTYDNDLTELYGKYTQKSRSEKEKLNQNLKCLIPNIESVEASTILDGGGVTLIIGQSHQDALIPLGLFGDGVIKLFRLIMEIMQWSGQRLMIDEVENGLHHSKMKDFLETILHTAKNQNTQLFATTHNLECLQKLKEVLEANPEFQEHTRIIRMADTTKFGIRAYTYNYNQFEFAMENENELR